MKVLVAGAGGAIGRQLVPMLVERGYDVIGTTRGDKGQAIEEMGAEAVRMDGLDPTSVARVVGRAEPDVIVHQLTALAGDLNLRRFERTFGPTNRLRREGTDHLLSAARATGTRRFIAQSYAGWPYERTGGPVKTEEDPLDPNPVPVTRSGLEALRHLEEAVTGAGPAIEGIVLRYGGFYGPGTSLSVDPDGKQTKMVRKRQFPIVGTGAGYWSLIHITDAASATLAAIEGGAPGIYNIADDEPAPIREIAAGPRRGDRGEAAAARPPLARASARRSDDDADDGGVARRLEREGEARARLAALLLELAAGLPGGADEGSRGSDPAKGYVVRAMSKAETAELEQLRGRAFAIAYRMLGSVGDAEDVAQEALIRFHSATEAGEAIDSPPAYVATIATRLAIDELRSARVRRETYVGEWLPEPLPTAADAAARPAGATAFPDPEAQAELADSLSLAFLVLLEQLTPEQRAALLLHDVFDYPHEEVAAIIGTTPAASRQLASRARRQVDEERPRFQSSAERQRELASRFFEAVQSGELGRLEALLADDVVLKGDGGGKVPALARPLSGRSRVAKAMTNWLKAGRRLGGIRYEPTEFNGQPGAITRFEDGSLLGAMVIESDGERITGINSVVNPEKLGHLGDVADYGAMLRRFTALAREDRRRKEAGEAD